MKENTMLRKEKKGQQNYTEKLRLRNIKKATVVYWYSNVINRLRKTNPGYKTNPREKPQL